VVGRADCRQDGVKDVARVARSRVNESMADLIFVAVFAGMMVVALGYVRVCERIVRSDEHPEREARR
jgi:hypothetical protein